MRVIWAHDNIFVKDPQSDNVYSEVEFPYSNWKRYLASFDQVKVISRQTELKNRKNIMDLNKTSGENVQFIKVPNLNSPKNILLKRNHALKIIRKELLNADAVIARLPSTIGSLVIEEAIKLKKPYGVELVGCPSDALKGLKSLKGKIYAPILTNKTKKAVLNASHVLYVTEKFLQQKYPTNGKNIACSNVKLESFEKEVSIPKKHKIEEKKYKIDIGLIGFLSLYKGVDTALKAIKQLSSLYPEITLNVLGKGEKDEWYKKAKNLGLKEKQLNIRVIRDKKEVMNWLDALDIYIQPSRTEGLPRGLIEAMSRGCPSIGSFVGGIPELIDYDFLHNPDDSEELFRLIVKFIENKEVYRTQSIKNYQVAKKYDAQLLEKKRREFWKDFSEEVCQKTFEEKEQLRSIL